MKKFISFAVIMSMMFSLVSIQSVHAEYTSSKTASMDDAVTDSDSSFKGEFSQFAFIRPTSSGSIHYAAQPNVFGKSSIDKCMYMYNDENEAYNNTDFNQNVRWGDNFGNSLAGWSAETPATDMTPYCKAGEYFELSFSMAYDGTDSEKFVDTFLVTSKVGSATRQKAAKTLLSIKDNTLSVWGEKINGVKLQPEKWYNFKFVFKAGTDRTYDFYIDDKLLISGATVTTHLYGDSTNKTPIADLYGIYQLWFTNALKASDGSEASLKSGAKFTRKELYIDDIAYKTYTTKSVYSALELSSDNRFANANINYNEYRGLQIFADRNDTVADLGVITTENENVTISEIRDGAGEEKAGSDLLAGNYAEFVREDGTKLYTTFTDSQTDIYNQSFGSEAPSDDNNLYTYLKAGSTHPDNTTAEVKQAVGGRENGDYSYVLTTTETVGASDNYAPRIQTNINAIVSAKLGYSGTEPFHYETSVFVNADCDAPAYFNIRLLNKDGGVYNFKPVSIWPDGRIKGAGDVKIGYRARENEWVKIRISVYPAKKIVSVYANERFMFLYDLSGQTAFKNEPIYKIDWMRIYQAYPYSEDGSEKYSGAFGFDDMYFYTGSAKVNEEISDIRIESRSEDITVDNDGSIIFIASEYVEVSDLFESISIDDATCEVFADASLNAELGAFDEISDDAVLCVTDGRLYKYYQLKHGNPRALELKDVTTEDGSVIEHGFVEGEQTWTINYESYQYRQGISAYVAEYRKIGNEYELIDITKYDLTVNPWDENRIAANYAYSSLGNESIEVNINTETELVKVFGWSNDSSLIPLCNFKRITKSE